MTSIIFGSPNGWCERHAVWLIAAMFVFVSVAEWIVTTIVSAIGGAA